MSSSTSLPVSPEVLLRGPRGRRLLLEYALTSELTHNPVRDEDSFGQAAVLAASRLHAQRAGGGALIGDVLVNEKAIRSRATPATAAERLNRVELLEPTPGVLRAALAAAVGHAQDWQEPDGEDLLVATSEMSVALRRVAEHVSAAQSTAWWSTPTDTRRQQSVQWDGAPPRPALGDAHETLRVARDQERGTREHRTNKPSASWSEEWRSSPPQIVPTSSRSLLDGTPGGLWFAEDSIGWDRAESVGLIVPDGLRIFEIESAADWKQLCVWFPLAVTTQSRGDWYGSSARTAHWLVPDWSKVSERYDAVHLQVGAYLAAAGVEIAVDENLGVASMIAGWNPDETYWFTPAIEYDDDRTRWRLEDHGTGVDWLPDETQP